MSQWCQVLTLIGAILETVLETSARLLRLLSLLQSRRDWTGTELARRLGAGAALPPLLLDDEEAVAVAISLHTATTGSVAGLEETSLRALTKLQQMLPSRLRHRISAFHATTVALAGPGSAPDRVDPDLLTALAAACRYQRRGVCTSRCRAGRGSTGSGSGGRGGRRSRPAGH